MQKRKVPSKRPSKEVEEQFPPLTATSKSLLVKGSDSLLRELIAGLLEVGAQVQELRSYIAAQIGVAEPQYRLLLAIAQMQKSKGVSVSAVAERLWISPNFVTMEVRKLHALGWVEKDPNPDDRRGVLLRLSPRGRAAFSSTISTIQQINDVMYSHLSSRDVESMVKHLKALTANGRRALSLVQSKTVTKTPTSATNPAGRHRR